MYIIENIISPELTNFLVENEIISEYETLISIEKPGEGNMNQVLRITTNLKSVILKQSRDYVNKYPQIEAPIARILVEAEFYKSISKDEFLGNKMPKLIGYYPDNYLIILEDLGKNSDFTYIYEQNSEILNAEIIELTKYLNQLHSIDIQQYPSNIDLKKLNHFHVFDFPFQLENGFDLDNIQTGLQEISLLYKSDEILKSKIKELGIKYLETHNTLLHGDYYPGSWLKTEQGIKVIDPEFGYLGMPEFDLGVFIAHLHMARMENLIETVFVNYKNQFDKSLVLAFTGIEVMRRILGVAQLTLPLNLQEKQNLLKKAKSFIEEYEN
jgi:5-methylthioribose kinase